MFKYFLIGVSLVMISSVSADANIKDEDASKTYLLTAPGTLSGEIRGGGANQAQTDGQFLRPDKTENRLPQQYQPRPRRYNYVDEDYNFPQYDQISRQNNPWYEQRPNSRVPPLPLPNRYSSNPWDLGGGPSTGAGLYRPRPFSSYPGLNQGYGQYGRTDSFQSDYPDGIFRDSNPASTMPFMNGVMPGLGGNDFGLPFSPFGMF